MADSRESVILDVKLDAGKVAADLESVTREVTNLRVSQKMLDKDLKDGNITFAEYDKQTLQIKDKLSWLQKEQKGLSATTKLLTADSREYGDSLNGMRQKLADMQKAYDQMDASMRDSEGGKAFLDAIREQSDAVKDLEANTGRAQRNVGNYPKAWADAVPAFSKVEQMLGKMGVSMESLSTKGGKAFDGLGQSVKNFGKAFITPPIVIITAVVGAVMLVFDKLREAFKKNDDAMTALQRGMSAFQPIVTAVGKAFDSLASAIGKAVEWTAKAVTSVLNLIPAYKEAAKAADDLVVAQDRLQDSERAYTVENAQRSRDIARLRAESAESKDLAARDAKLKEAMALERKDLAEKKRITAERLRLLEAEAKKNNDTSDEMKDKIAQARAAMYQAEEAYYTGVKKLQREMNSVQQATIREEEEKRKAAAEEAKRKAQEAAAERKRVAEENKRAAAERKAERERRAKEQADFERAQAQTSADIQRQAEDFALSLIEDEGARKIAARRLQGEREIAELKTRLATDKTLTEEAQAQLAIIIKGKQEQLDAELLKMADDAANAKTEAEYKSEQERAQRILELRAELAADGSEEEMRLQQELLDAKMQQELENTELTEEEKQLIRETFAQKREQLDKDYHDNLVKQAQDAKEAYRDALMNTAKDASNAFGAMSDLLSQYGEDSEKAQKASKAFGIAKIITDQAMSIADTAKAITAAVAGATEAAASTGPAAPFVLGGYIASMVGAVLGAVASVASSIGQAKQLMASDKKDAGKFESGGVVGGTSYTGDRLIAHVNSGEGIYNTRQANNLLQEIANNPIRGGFDYEAMAAAVAALPAPVLNYNEFTSFEGRVATYNEIASI